MLLGHSARARGPEPKLTPYREGEFVGFLQENDRFQLAASTLALASAGGPEAKLTPYREPEIIGFPEENDRFQHAASAPALREGKRSRA